MRFTYQTGAQPLDGYTIQRGIHRGGFGEVYFARSHGGKEVALKLLHEQDQDVEIRGVSQCLNLKHPNLINLHDVKSDQHGDYWVVMEYVSGSSLEDVLTSFPDGLPLNEISDWMNGLVAGVAFLHERGIVHRDLKPANIYREAGIVKVGDVGLSKRLGGERRQHTQSVGTVYYMAPEVAKGQYGPEVDVYSLGVILYEMVSGKLPFSGETTAEILMKHLTAQPDLTLIPTPLRATIARALEKDPAKRTPNVRQLGSDVRTALQSFKGSQENFQNEPAWEQKPNFRSDGQSSNVNELPFWRRSFDQNWEYARECSPAKLVLACVVAYASISLLAGVVVGSGRPRIMALVLGIVGLLITRRLITKKKSSCSQRFRPPAPVALPSPQPKKPSLSTVSSWNEVGPGLMNSLGISALLSAGMILLISAWMNSRGQPSPSFANVAQTAFVTATSIVGCWAILAGQAWTLMARSAQRRHGLLRLMTGAAIGVCAFGISRFLMLDIPYAAFTTEAAISAPRNVWLIDVSNPTMAGYCLFFAFWMGVNNWSRKLHPHREHRMRFASVLFSVGSAYLIATLCSFPQYYAMIWAGVISTSVQLAAAKTPVSLPRQ